MADSFSPEEHTRVRRAPKRADYDRDTIYAILDDGLVAHIGIAVGDRPFVIPIFYARNGNEILIHGATKSRLMNHIEEGREICITVTELDGLVLARSAFHHSMNYRSVVLFGKGRIVEAAGEKEEAARAITEKVLPGRWDDTRAPNSTEYKATTLIAIEIEAGSAKVRAGGPIDDDEDMDLPHWAGVVPVRRQLGEPIPDEATRGPIPGYLQAFLTKSE